MTIQRGAPKTPTSPTTTVRIIRVALGCRENVTIAASTTPQTTLATQYTLGVIDRPARSSRNRNETFFAARWRFSISFKESTTDLRREVACSRALTVSRPFDSMTPFSRESFSLSPEKYG